MVDTVNNWLSLSILMLLSVSEVGWNVFTSLFRSEVLNLPVSTTPATPNSSISSLKMSTVSFEHNACSIISYFSLRVFVILAALRGSYEF